MTRHVLKTEGAWVDLREVEDLRARDRKAVEAVVYSSVDFDIESGGVTANERTIAQISSAAPDAVAAALIFSWEIPYLPDARIPRLDPEILGELRLDDYDRLMELVEPAQKLLMPRGSSDVDDHADPQSPSGPAGG